VLKLLFHGDFVLCVQEHEEVFI